MATTTSIIQLRRGAYADFDPQKMKPGEIAVITSGDPLATDGKAIYMAFAAGQVKRLSTTDDIYDVIYNQTEEIAQQIKDDVADDVQRAEDAAERIEGLAEQISLDKSTGVKLSAYINNRVTPTVVRSDTNTMTVYFPCISNVTYTINKVLSARFRVGYTATVPADSVQIYGVIADNDATSISLTTGSNAQYIVIYYYDSANDTESESTIYNSLEVTYNTAVDKVARADIETLESNVSDLDDDLDGKVDKQQAIADAGKALIIGDDGVVYPEEIDTSGGLSDDAKAALLACFEHVEWNDDDGQYYYDALESALNSGRYPCIKVAFNANGHRFFPYDIVSTLKNFIIVTYYETEESGGVVVSNNDVILSGALTTGTSRIKVMYNELSTSFVVPVEELVRNSDLPSDYEQVTYIFGNGTQYITTNLISRLPMRVEARIRRGIGQPVIGAGDSSVSNSRFFLVAFQHDYVDGSGTRIASRISDDMPSQPSSTESAAVYGAWFYNRLVNIYQDVVYDVVSGVNSVGNSRVNTYITVDGKTASIERKAPTTGYPFVFIKVPITSSIGRLYIYAVKFYSGDTLLFDGVPCYRKSDGNAGIYDTVSGTFFGNSGTGEFLIGDVVE